MGASEPFMGFADPVFAIYYSFADMHNEYNIIPLDNIAILNSKPSSPETVNC
jgi:hypothetical protein